MTWLVADSIWWDGRLRHACALSGSRLAALDEIPAGAARLRFPGTLLPGLTDAHVHAQLVDLGTVRAGGIAGVWDLGGSPAYLSAVASQPGVPRVIFAGQFLTAPGGYPSDRPWAPAGSCRAVLSTADADSAVASQVASGATLVKVTLHAGGPLLPGAAVAAIVSAAHASGLRVVVHAEGTGTVATAVSSGADLLAHTPWTSSEDDGVLRAAAAAGMRWISTLDIHGFGRETPSSVTAIGNLRRFLGYGGSVVYGTDLGNGPLVPGVNAREVRALLGAGLSPSDVLTAMTGDAADLPPCWIPGGLSLDPADFADVLATARVVGPEVRPRP